MSFVWNKPANVGAHRRKADQSELQKVLLFCVASPEFHKEIHMERVVGILLILQLEFVGSKGMKFNTFLTQILNKSPKMWHLYVERILSISLRGSEYLSHTAFAGPWICGSLLTLCKIQKRINRVCTFTRLENTYNSTQVLQKTNRQLTNFEAGKKVSVTLVHVACHSEALLKFLLQIRCILFQIADDYVPPTANTSRETRTIGVSNILYGMFPFGSDVDVETQNLAFDPTLFGTVQNMLFNLDSQLWLNISFLNFLLGYQKLFHRRVGYLSVKTNVSKHTFLGQRPQTSVYVGHNKINISVFAAFRAQCKIEMWFSIVDQNIIVSESFRNTGTRSSVQGSILTFPGQLVKYFHIHITVTKWCSLLIKADFESNTSTSFYDGPDVASEAIEPINIPTMTGSFFQASTFQGVVLHWGSAGSGSLSKLRFGAQDLPKINISVTRNESLVILYPSRKCTFDPKVCVVELSARTRYQINLTVLDMHIQSTGSEKQFYASCLYAGLHVKDYKATSDMCMATEGYKHRSVYSHTSTLSLVFYSYPTHADFNTSVLISQSSCKVTSINTCVFSMPPYSFGKDHKQFVGPVVKPNCFTTSSRGCLNSPDHHLTINPQSEECVVVQLNHDAREYAKIHARNGNSFFSFMGSEHFRLGVCTVRNIMLNVDLGNTVQYIYSISGHLAGACCVLTISDEVTLCLNQ